MGRTGLNAKAKRRIRQYLRETSVADDKRLAKRKKNHEKKVGKSPKG